jgi:hypothetical protein
VNPADHLDVALRVTGVLDDLGIAHTIGGSIASSIAGEPRSTIDIDIVAALDEPHVDRFVAALGDEFYVDEVTLRRAITDRATANLIHQDTSRSTCSSPAGPRLMRSSSRGAWR